MPRPTSQRDDFASQFARPAGEVRPSAWLHIFWYPMLGEHPTHPLHPPEVSAEELERQVQIVSEAGLGTVNAFDYDFAPATKENGLFESMLEAAKRHGIMVDVTIGPRSDRYLAADSPDDELDQCEIVYGTAFVDAGTTFSGNLPEPLTNPDQPRTLVAAVGARCATANTEVKPVLLEPESLVDLTSVVKDGRTSWTPPADDGRWILFALWERPVISYLDNAREVDYFSLSATKAVTDYWDEHVFTPRIQQLLDEVGRDLHEDSLHLSGYQLWTRDFLAEFTRRRGYSLRGYLPVTFIPYMNDWGINTFDLGQSQHPDAAADFDLPGDAGRRIRNDYYQTLSELYEENHLKPLNEWARSHGLSYRAKPSVHQSFDISAATAVDVPNTEEFVMAGKLDGYRALAGPVHLGRKNRFVLHSCVTATRVGEDLYSSTWQQLLALIHRGFAAGANQVDMHAVAYPHSPNADWPGYWPFEGKRYDDEWGLGLGEALGPRMPYWDHMPDISNFLSREQLVLRLGEPHVDLAIYRHAFWHHGFPHFPTHRAGDDFNWYEHKGLERAGFSYDFVGPSLFDLPNATVDGGQLDPGGPAYKALVLAPDQFAHVDGLPLAAAEAMLEFARAGLPIVLVGVLPASTGFFGDSADDPAVRGALEGMLAEASVRQVPGQADVPAALADLGVRPDFEPAQPSNVIAAHRSSEAGDFYFLYNQQNRNTMTGEFDPPPAAFDEQVSLAGSGRPYELDAWTGEIRPIAPFVRDQARVRARVRLAPGETTIIALASWGGDLHALSTTAEEVLDDDGHGLRIRDTRPGTYTTKLSTGQTVSATIGDLPPARTLSEWHLSVEDWQPGATATETNKVRHELDLASLAPWPAIPELEDVSGIGRYTTKVDLDSHWAGALLDLGPLFDSVRVSINRKRLPAVNLYRAVVDVTQYIEHGANTIEVEVATTLRNRLRSLPEWPEAARLPRQPYGLVGPVRLVPYGTSPLTGS